MREIHLDQMNDRVKIFFEGRPVAIGILKAVEVQPCEAAKDGRVLRFGDLIVTIAVIEQIADVETDTDKPLVGEFK